MIPRDRITGVAWSERLLARMFHNTGINFGLFETEAWNDWGYSPQSHPDRIRRNYLISYIL